MVGPQISSRENKDLVDRHDKIVILRIISY